MDGLPHGQDRPEDAEVYQDEIGRREMLSLWGQMVYVG